MADVSVRESENASPTPPQALWLEVALNGGWGAGAQPLIPMTTDDMVREGVACVKAGASVVHFHTYDEATGKPNDDLNMYIAVIEEVRSQVDAIVYPTIAFDGDDRYVIIEALAKRGLLEWCTLDTGSVNLSSYADVAGDIEGSVYINSEQTIRRGMTVAREFGVHPTFACYEPGFIRLGAALMRRYGDVPQAVYRLMFSDSLTFGFPPEKYALDSYRRLLASEVPEAAVMIAGLGVDLDPIARTAVDGGLHLRVGLEDAPLGSRMTNLQWVEHAIEHYCGSRRLAKASEIRQTLKS